MCYRKNIRAWRNLFCPALVLEWCLEVLVMDEAARYRRNANVCIAYAREAESQRREIYLEIAEHWMELAQEADAKTGAPTNVIGFGRARVRAK